MAPQSVTYDGQSSHWSDLWSYDVSSCAFSFEVRVTSEAERPAVSSGSAGNMISATNLVCGCDCDDHRYTQWTCWPVPVDQTPNVYVPANSCWTPSVI